MYMYPTKVPLNNKKLDVHNSFYSARPRLFHGVPCDVFAERAIL